jgi:hypothetical protein
MIDMITSAAHIHALDTNGLLEIKRASRSLRQSTVASLKAKLEKC